MDTECEPQMEDPCHDPYDSLLEGHNQPPTTQSTSLAARRESWGTKIKQCFDFITVEPLTLFYQFAIVSQTTTNGEYILLVYEHLYEHNGTNISTGVDTVSKGEILAATQSADFITIISLLSALPPLFLVYFYGTISDHVGRKRVLMIPVIGQSIGVFLNMMIVYGNLDVYWFLLPTCLIYISGGPLVLNTLVYAYICDIATFTHRTTRMLYIKVAETAALALGQLLTGFLITYCGYFYTQMLMFFVSFIGVIYIIFAVKESRPADHGKRSFNIMGILRTLPRIICAHDGNWRRLKMSVYSYVIAINALYDSGGLIVSVISSTYNIKCETHAISQYNVSLSWPFFYEGDNACKTLLSRIE